MRTHVPVSPRTVVFIVMATAICSLGLRLRLSAVPRSTQPCIHPGSLNQVPALTGVRAGMSPLYGTCVPIAVRQVSCKLSYICILLLYSARWQLTLSDPIWHVSSHSDEGAGLLTKGKLPYHIYLLSYLMLRVVLVDHKS